MYFPYQDGEKYFTSWEPRFLGQYFAQDSVIHGPAGADKKLILVKRNQFLSQEINSCHKKSILAPRNQFLPQEINSCHKKSILVTRNHFLWAHILRLNLSIHDNAWILPNILLELIHFVGTWFPGSQGICRPARHPHDTLQTMSKHLPDTHKTVTKIQTCKVIPSAGS